MFSSTSYEAYYKYLGLELHTRFIEAITSQKVFGAIILLTFGFAFFMTTARFFSQYLPGGMVSRQSVPASRYIAIVFYLVLGLSLLRVGTWTSVHDYNRDSWHTNPYISTRIRDPKPAHKVSFVFDLISRSAEEFAALINRVVDSTFKSEHSQLTAPGFFFRAIGHSGAASIEDPNLREAMDFYFSECFSEAIPLLLKDNQRSFISRLFAEDDSADTTLRGIVVDKFQNREITCLDIKNDVSEGLKHYARSRAGRWINLGNSVLLKHTIDEKFLTKFQASSAIVNYVRAKREQGAAVSKGAAAPGGSTVENLLGIDKLLSMDTGFSLLFGDENRGAASAASRAKALSDHLQRAPHVAGFIIMLLTALFPFLVFPVVAGYWRIIPVYFLTYLSVLMWQPVFTLMYHVMLGILLSSEVMEGFGKLSDGVSLYSAQLIQSRFHYAYSAYATIQLIVGPTLTGAMLFFLRGFVSDSQPESTPPAVEKVKSIASPIVGNATSVADQSYSNLSSNSDKSRLS